MPMLEFLSFAAVGVALSQFKNGDDDLVDQLWGDPLYRYQVRRTIAGTGVGGVTPIET